MHLLETPLVRLNFIEQKFNLNNKVYAKVESFNPSGSIKARTVLGMLEYYKNNGVLKEGSTIVEATSGNTGIALSYFSKEMNYKAIIVMPNSVSIQRRQIIEKYGGKVVLITGGMKECHEKVSEILKNVDDAFEFGQFDCLANPKTHYLTTAPEIYKQCPDVNFVFAGVGTGGTISGIGKFFKVNKLDVKAIGVEPLNSNILNGGKPGPHLIQGIGANFIPNTYLGEFVDEVVDVDDLAAIEMAKLIRSEEKIDIGISSGAALLGAIQYIKKHNIKNKNVVIIFPDKGDRYSW